MGQQQLLLLVLATVIVGLATVAGIQAFEQGQVRANQDALTSTAVKIASDIQARAKEPTQFGGYDGNLSSGTPKADGNITLEELGYTTNSNNVYVAADGKCGIVTGGGSGSVGVTADQASFSSSKTIEILCESGENEVLAGVSGTNPDDITSTAATLGS
jgi:hypothetical protein